MKAPYHFFDDVVIRFSALASTTVLEASGEKDLIKLFEENKTAIYLASPDLYDVLLKLDSLDGKKRSGALNSLHRYLLRMGTRPTPFGLFSALGTGRWHEETNACITQTPKAVLSLDYRVLNGLFAWVSADAEVTDKLRYFINDTLCVRSPHVQLIRKAGADYAVSLFDKDEGLDAVIDFVGADGKRLEEICQCLVDLGAAREDAQHYLSAMVDGQILVSELQLPIRKKDAFVFLLQVVQLMKLNDIRVESVLQEIHSEVRTINRDQAFTIDRLEQLRQRIVTLMPSLSNEKNFFKVDLFAEGESLLIGRHLQKDVMDALNIMSRVGFGTLIQDLDNFREAFLKKYDTAMVPLMDLFGPDTIIDYSPDLTERTSPLIDDLPFPHEGVMTVRSAKERQLYQLVLDALLEGKKEIVLDEDFNAGDSGFESFGNTLAVGIRTTTTSAVYLEFIGSNGASVINRFSYANATVENIIRYVSDYENEAASERIVAEINHLPDLKAANVIYSTPMKKYCIPLLDNPLPDHTTVIPISDLLVGVRNDRVVIYSQSLSKEVMPQFTNALSSRISRLPLFRFLSDVGYQYRKGYTFSWQRVAGVSALPFVPRLRYKNVVLAPALWKISWSRFAAKAEGKQNEEVIDFIRMTLNLPRYVSLADAERNDLVLDLENKLSASLLLRELKKEEEIVVHEYLFIYDRLVTNESGHTHGSQIITFLKKDPVSKVSPVVASATSEGPRYFPPGSEWAYYQIPGNEKKLDNLLRDVVPALVIALKGKGLIDKWFFVRYWEHGLQLRLRFHATDETKNELLVTSINTLLREGFSDFKIDSYAREVDRYGGDLLMEGVEELFCYDSEFALATCIHLPGDEEERWLFTMRGIDHWIGTFELTLPERITLLESVCRNFESEFGSTTALFKSINEKHRTYRVKFELFFNDSFLEKYHPDLFQAMCICDSKARIVVTRIRQLNAAPDNWKFIIRAILHLHVNRVIRSQPRAHEFVLYQLLLLRYRTALKMEEGAKNG